MSGFHSPFLRRKYENPNDEPVADTPEEPVADTLSDDTADDPQSETDS